MKPLLCIVGPTASGKSALALEVARQIGGEIISCDSMQIYIGCDIVTAKATPQERAQIPHHLLDICAPTETFSAATWAASARTAIADIEARGKIPVVCGGTGFYLRALLEPASLAAAPPDFALRARLEAELAAIGNEAIHARLAQMDALAAARLHPNDTHRTLRALEIALSGCPAQPGEAPPHPAHIFALAWPRELLNERIHARVETMLAEGALEETRALLAQFGPAAPALGSVGYKQLVAHLRGEVELSVAVELWKTATRQYAKRQGTWFRGQTSATWLDAMGAMEELVERVVSDVSELDTP